MRDNSCRGECGICDFSCEDFKNVKSNRRIKQKVMPKIYTENYSLKEVAEMIADSILQERMLSKQGVVTKILTYYKSFAGIKQDPKVRPRVIEPTQAERNAVQSKFWHDIVLKNSTPHQMAAYYRDRDLLLKEKDLL